MSKHLVDTIRVRQERSQSVVETVSIASIFPPYSSDAEIASFVIIIVLFLQQNVVLQVTMDGLSQWWFFRIMKGDHARKKAMRIAVGLSGVESATIKGQDKDQIEVKGEGIDTVKLATTLRKKVGHANIVSVGPPSCGLPPCTYYEIPRYDDTPSCSIM
ncbi:heavy metal-associated isoprenylated plant protein 16 [Quercus suber]|uniref:Heavy metal-associated isoprenylated plant protein 16 n=1 Tax=Quercus suber TaxID=58331 RepID=A0AAW0KZL3_QUESU